MKSHIPAYSYLFSMFGKQHQMGKKPILFLTIFFLTIAALQTGQDFLHAHLHGYQGYLSDSLVYKIYWLVFIPTFGILSRRSQPIKEKIPGRLRWPTAIGGVLLLSTMHILLVALLIVAVSNLFFYHPFPFSTPFGYFASEHFYLTLFFYSGGIAIIFLFKREIGIKKDSSFAASPRHHANHPDKFADFISVSVQNKLVPIPTKEILCIQADRPYVNIHTGSGQYLHSSTLKDMQEKLCPDRFVRIHRSTIIHTEQVDHILSRANGDYDVILKNGKMVRMSRNYFPAFKKLMD